MSLLCSLPHRYGTPHMNRISSSVLVSSLAIVGLSLGVTAQAAERQFTFTTQSSVLTPGTKEAEVITTYRAGRVDYFRAMDTRLELEVGVTDQFQTAIYLNWNSTTKADGSGGTTTESGFESVSLEGKYKLSDSVADALGSALYAEATLGSEEAELEFKGIVDKRLGNILVAANGVYEAEFEMGPEDSEIEHVLKLTAGASYFVKPTFALGFEVVQKNVIEESEHEHAMVHAGPVAFYNAGSFWLTTTAMWQLVDFNEATPGYDLNLSSSERFAVRMIFGTDF